MMKKSMVMIVAGIFLLSPVIAMSYQNEPDGFRGIKWGTDIKDIVGMSLISADGKEKGIKIYERNEDELLIGDATINKIVYYFWDNTLISVLIKVEGLSNYNNLKNAVFEKFGSGNKTNRYIERYFWFGGITAMSLEYKEIMKEGALFMSSKILNEKKKEYEKERAKEGAKKGF